MKTATVRDLRNHYTGLLRWIAAGEEILITRRGKPLARLIPEKPARRKKVDWSTSREVMRDRSGDRILTAEESRQLIQDAGGKW
jgi:prevent-host-death family protein